MHRDALFEGTLRKTDAWLDDLMVELDTTDRHAAYRALRAVLQAVRDRLGVNEVAHLAAQLPALLRGVLYEGWHPADKPLHLRREQELVSLVRRHHGPGHIDVGRAIPAVLRTIERHTTGDVVGAIRRAFPASLDRLMNGEGGAASH